MIEKPRPSFADIGYPPFDRPVEQPQQANWGSTADYVLLSEAIKVEHTKSGTDLIYAVVNKTTKHVEWRAKTLTEALQALSGLQEGLDTERGSGTVKN